MTSVDSLLEGKRIVICAGSGGVGKTTTAAALGLGMAERGLRVAVVTIDPARRLATSLGLEERDPTGPMSVVGAGRVAGEVASQHEAPVLDRFLSVILLLAGLNLFLGLINLVPLPPFDGGGIATTLYETVRRGLARLRGRPDPGGVDAAKLLPVTYVMATVILVVSVVLVVADVLAPITLS